MSLVNYSPIDVVISVAGLHTVTGLAEGNFVRIIKNSKPFETQRAMDGTRQRLFHFEEGYKVEITLAQSSASNNVFSAIHNVDLLTRKMMFPLMIRDTRGQTSFFAASAWIDQVPEVSFSSQLETRTWVFGASDAALVVGGNGTTTMLEDALLMGTAALPLLSEFGLFGG